MSNKKYTLVINPGATSTKAAIYEGETEVFTENLSHPIEEIQKFHEVADQFPAPARAAATASTNS